MSLAGNTLEVHVSSSPVLPGYWLRAQVGTCEKAEKDGGQVAATGLLSRMSVLVCRLC